jgi:hypothetical protein
VLDLGVWQERRIVSADWIKQMTARQSPSRFSFGHGVPMVTFGGKADLHR